jgi:hypothetical protein
MRALGGLFDEIDATPRTTPLPEEDSGVISMVDLGGGS